MAQNYKGPLDYIDVATRIVEFREKYPNGSLQQVSLDFREVNNKWWVIYTAAAFRTPDDIRPGVGTAWEPIPGPTNFTRDSEVQNAETAAWGRAMVAALAVDTKKGIASSEEVRNRSEKTTDAPKPPSQLTTFTPEQLSDAQVAADQIPDIVDLAELTNLYKGVSDALILNAPVQNGKKLVDLLIARRDEINAAKSKEATK